MTNRLVAHFTVPGTPVPKQRPRHGANGKTYTPKETLAAEEKIGWAFMAGWRDRTRYPPALIAEGKVRLRLEVDAYVPDLRTRDWDNIGKTVSDGLNLVAYKDDGQIWSAHVDKFVDAANPRTEVRLYLME
jgi:Holliday junction resolvase RusA-like endonuclease